MFFCTVNLLILFFHNSTTTSFFFSNSVMLLINSFTFSGFSKIIAESNKTSFNPHLSELITGHQHACASIGGLQNHSNNEGNRRWSSTAEIRYSHFTKNEREIIRW